jgi:SAM-dependent methyltransferase
MHINDAMRPQAGAPVRHPGTVWRVPRDWWSSEGGFFGANYRRGDDSREGFLAREALDLGERTRREVDGLEALLRLGPGASVMDCPCGYGRHSLELAGRGYAVVGVDINEDHLDAAAKALRARDARLDLRFRRRDMRDLQDSEAFDAIVNMFYSYGFFEEDEENFRVLTGWHRALKPGGQLLIHTDVNIPRITAGTYRLEESRALSAGGTLQIREQYSHRTRRVTGTWTLEDAAGLTPLTPYSMRVFTVEELTEWLHDARFSKVEAFADWSGAAYHPDAEEMILVARK